MDSAYSLSPSAVWADQMSLRKRQWLLIAFVTFTAVGVLGYAILWGDYRSTLFWYMAGVWLCVFILAAIKNHGWEVEEGHRPRGFEVLPHDKDKP